MAEKDDEETVLQFHEMGLDDRILEAISKLGWKEPTLIQEKAIPLALEGKDILAKARTGSGKTAAFVIPIIHKILQSKQASQTQDVKAVILAPSKELCKQIYDHFLSLTSCCSREVKCVYLSGQADIASQRPLLLDKPDVVIASPSRVLAHLQDENLYLKESLETLVIDEADLMFSFGYEADVKNVISHLPQIYQAFLMSATLNDEVNTLKKIVLHNALILKLEEPPLPQSQQLTQYIIKAEDEDKYVLLYALFKLMLVRGKSIIFVNSISKCYRLKIYLEQFGVRSCIMNSELPASNRCDIITKFNQGIYNIIIAADEFTLENPAGQSKSKRFPKKDSESGASRGIDFYRVSNIINFDFPLNLDSYIHRVGRTARGRSHGTALSFVNIHEQTGMEEIRETLAQQMGVSKDAVFRPYRFNMEEVKAFRYRARDVLASVTRAAVREARLKEIKKQLLTSQKLKSYFEDNPKDQQVLRHDQELFVVRKGEHLKHVPDYIVPPSLKSSLGIAVKPKRRPREKPQQQAQPSRAQRKYKRKQEDPLQSFEFSGFGKKKK